MRKYKVTDNAVKPTGNGTIINLSAYWILPYNSRGFAITFMMALWKSVPYSKQNNYEGHNEQNWPIFTGQKALCTSCQLTSSSASMDSDGEHLSQGPIGAALNVPCVATLLKKASDNGQAYDKLWNGFPLPFLCQNISPSCVTYSKVGCGVLAVESMTGSCSKQEKISDYQIKESVTVLEENNDNLIVLHDISGGYAGNSNMELTDGTGGNKRHAVSEVTSCRLIGNNNICHGSYSSPCVIPPTLTHHMSVSLCLQYILTFLILMSSTCPVNSRPQNGIQSDTRRSSGPRYDYQPPTFDSTTYLSRFGYLPRSDLETGALRNKTELTRAVRKFQRMAHLPVTGELDQRTTDKMQEPRCGVSDDLEDYFTDAKEHKSRHKRYVLGPSKWPNHDLTFRILNYSPDLGSRETRDAILSAFRVWSDVTQLNFREIYHGHPDIAIKFAHMYHGDGYSFDGEGGTLAHAFFPGPDDGGDVHFDEDELWTVQSQEGVNLFIVAAHEMGHALGLGHSSVLGALMYPWYQGYAPQFSLPSDDLVAIQYLYGRRDPPTLPPYPGQPPTTTTRRPVVRPTPSTPPVFTTRAPVVPTTPNWTPNQPPDKCTTDIDAAALVRQEAYLFKGTWFWRIDRNGVMDGYPVELDRFWYGFPKDLDHLDAVYERVDDGKIVFFSGKRFWVFNGNHMITGFPTQGKPLSDMGFPDDIERVDAAFIWGYNLKTYLITGNMYWRYNEDLARMDYDYPRDMSMWDGVPVPVDASLKLWDGYTYFFQGQNFWRFHDTLMKVDRGYPEKIGPYWLECEYDSVEGPSDPNTAPRQAIHSSMLGLLMSYWVLYFTCQITTL